MQNVEAQIRELQQAYPATTIVKKSATTTLLQVAATTTLTTGEPCSVQLFLTVPSNFPHTPPRVATLNGLVTVPCTSVDYGDVDDEGNHSNSNTSTPGNADDGVLSFLYSSPMSAASREQLASAIATTAAAASSSSSSSDSDNSATAAAAAAAWRTARLSLSDVVRNALAHVVQWWGAVRPPDMASTVQQLRGETDQLLHDLAANPNCLDAYCYQLPTMKQMREAATATVTQVEGAALTNQRLQSEVVQLRAHVQQLQTSLQQQVDALRPLNGNKLLSAVASPQALLQTLEADVHTLSNECKQDGRRVLALHATDRRAFQEALAAYRAKSARMHLLELKRSIYKAQLSH